MNATATSTEYDQLISKTKDANSLGATISLLHWDQEVMMPKRGIEYRSGQIALASKMHHELVTDSQLGELLEACDTNAD